MPLVIYIQEFSHMKPRYVIIRDAFVELTFEIINCNDPKHEQE